jgi:hypothetical protein
MANIVIASDDLVVLGGPASVKVELDVGATGARGSQIFTDAGKPTKPGLQFPVPPQINDLYINLDPSDLEYLFLYQYKLDNAVLGWTKLLRLIPTTILFNPTLKFINGEAHSSVILGEEYENATVDVRGLYFPITGTLENENIENLDYRDLNLQYEIISPKPSFGGAELKEINSVFNIEYFNPVTQEYVEVEDFDFGARYLHATLKLVETNDDLELNLVTGYRKLDMVLTIAGRAESVIDIFAVNVANPAISSPGFLTIPSHGLIQGSRFGYLANGNTSIVGLTDQADYYVAQVIDANNVVITQDGVTPVTFLSNAKSGIHSIVKAGAVL